MSEDGTAKGLIWPSVFCGLAFAGAYLVFQIPGEEKECGGETMAYVMSQDFMKQRLKSPSTAEFPWYTDGGVHADRLSECVYGVVGFVDSQNGFGATVRTRYSIEVEYLPGKRSWTARDLILE